MITIFSNPRPFTGPFDIIQQNAIRSWKQIKPEVQIILFEDEEGTTKKIANELHVDLITNVKTNEFGTPLIDGVFEKIKEYAKFDIVAQVNADIILSNDFVKTINKVCLLLEKNPFLMVGRRWDLDVKKAIKFDSQGMWFQKLINRLPIEGKLHGMSGIDYWIFRKDYLFDPPPFVVGRPGFDSWLVYKARSNKIPVIDATELITIIHQNHDYPLKREESFHIECERNFKLVGGYWSAFSLRDANKLLDENGIKNHGFPKIIYSTLSTNYFWRIILMIKRKIHKYFRTVYKN
jgi:hypothetical protein|tara:strand:- start:2673 stop:3548 length:876 start_codon:yes stop_codon:yes gene_type:complete